MSKPTVQQLWNGSITAAPELAEGQPAWQQRAIRICSSTAFEVAVIAVILINAVTIGMQTYFAQGSPQRRTLEAFDWPIVAFFTVEVVLRFVAHRCSVRAFVKNPWNVFDALVVVIGVLPHLAQSLTILRAVRLLRVARLLRVMPDIAVLTEGIRRALGPALSLGGIIALGTYIYAVLGTLLFSRTAPQYFDNIGEGMLTLFELLTLEGWNDIFADLREASPWGLVYTLAFVICGTFVVVNFVVGVIVTSLEDAYEAQRGVSEDDVMSVLRGMETKIDELQQEVRELRQSDPAQDEVTARSSEARDSSRKSEPKGGSDS